MMMDFSIISIVLYSISGFLFVVFVIVFFMTDVTYSIKFIRQKNKSTQNSDMTAPTIGMTKNSENTENNVTSQNDIKQKDIIPDNIEQVQNTVDMDTSGSNIENIETFETLDCDLSEDISFVLTRNIVIRHNDREY